MIELIRADMERYRDSGGWYRHPGFWAGATYRFGAWAHACRIPPLRFLLLVVYKVAATPWRVLRSLYIPARARIGPGLCLLHPHNIQIPPEGEIGANCTMYHEVTLGRGPTPGVPRIGDGVSIYPGAKVLGGIHIGDGVRIGANAVATRDVPAGASLAVPAARVIPREMVVVGPRWPSRDRSPSNAG